MANQLLQVREVLVALHRRDSGQDMIEYALIAGLIGLAAVVGMNVVANEINQAFSRIAEKFEELVIARQTCCD
jgi:pilus assembly protein Flp/PilA